jgi:CO/xanthine dehydrogenase Mo-binding subunit
VSKEKPGGMGEVDVPLVAPAIGNAVFTLTDGGINFV